MKVYEVCPMYKGNVVTIKKTVKEDTNELLECYSDKEALPLFNSDNCHGDYFYYATAERMEQAIDFWTKSYIDNQFVRWTVYDNNTNKRLGTVEMFNRSADDEFDGYGVLRIDLSSKNERCEIVEGILDIADKHFYEDFDVRQILTKAIPCAKQRIKALTNAGYKPLGRKFMNFDDYYVK